MLFVNRSFLIIRPRLYEFFHNSKLGTLYFFLPCYSTIPACFYLSIFLHSLSSSSGTLGKKSIPCLYHVGSSWKALILGDFNCQIIPESHFSGLTEPDTCTIHTGYYTIQNLCPIGVSYKITGGREEVLFSVAEKIERKITLPPFPQITIAIRAAQWSGFKGQNVI